MFRFLLLFFVLFFPFKLSASDFSEADISKMRSILDQPIVYMALKSQNEKTSKLNTSEIDTLDKSWRSESEKNFQPVIAQLMGNPLSTYLIRKKAESNGLFMEIFVFDSKGLNTGQSSITSDYWQGDEDKYLKTFALGSEAVFIDEPEFDKDLNVNRQQVSFVITDPDTKESIGAVTVEVNLSEWERRFK